MYVKKSNFELNYEYKQRAKKLRFVIIVSAVLLLLFIGLFGVENSLDLFTPNDAYGILYFIIFVLSCWVTAKSYVSYGIFKSTSGRRCLTCHRAWGYSNDGFGFMHFGSDGNKKWYQINACSRSDCDVVRNDELKWVPSTVENDKNESENQRSEFYVRVSWSKYKATDIDVHSIRKLDEYYKNLPLNEARSMLKKTKSILLGPYDLTSAESLSAKAKEYGLNSIIE